MERKLLVFIFNRERHTIPKRYNFFGIRGTVRLGETSKTNIAAIVYIVENLAITWTTVGDI